MKKIIKGVLYMLSIIVYGSIIIGGAIAYGALGGEYKTIERQEEKKELNTYDYFSSLTLEEQRRYYENNLDLRYYKDDVTVGLTDDRYFNAKHAEEIARRTGKEFTNRHKVY